MLPHTAESRTARTEAKAKAAMVAPAIRPKLILSSSSVLSPLDEVELEEIEEKLEALQQVPA